MWLDLCLCICLGLGLGLCVFIYIFGSCACKPRSLTIGWYRSYGFRSLSMSWTISCTRWLGLNVSAISVSKVYALVFAHISLTIGWSHSCGPFRFLPRSKTICKYLSPLDGLIHVVPSDFCPGLRQFANISHHWIVSFMWSQVQVPGWWSLWYPLVLPPRVKFYIQAQKTGFLI